MACFIFKVDYEGEWCELWKDGELYAKGHNTGYIDFWNLLRELGHTVVEVEEEFDA